MNPVRRTLGLFRVAAGALLGVMLFFTFGIAPALFRNFPRETAGGIAAVLFPAYYLAIYLLLAVAIGAVLLGRGGIDRWQPAGLALLAAVLLIGTIDFKIAPIMHGLSLPADAAQFRRFHGMSMLLNLLAQIAAAASLVLARPARAEATSREPQSVA